MHSSDPIIQAVLKADHLSEETRRVYSKNLSMIAQAARQQPLVKVLTQHPHKVVQYIQRKCCKSEDTACVNNGSLQAARLKGQSSSSYELYLDYFDKLDAILKERSKTNLPTRRQAAGFVTHEELQHVRERLPIGSKERLLLSCYGGCIPPVRNDLHAAFIHRLKCDEGEARNAIMNSITPNCILLPYKNKKEGALILREFKTQDRANPKLYTRRLGLQLSDEI